MAEMIKLTITRGRDYTGKITRRNTRTRRTLLSDPATVRAINQISPLAYHAVGWSACVYRADQGYCNAPVIDGILCGQHAMGLTEIARLCRNVIMSDLSAIVMEYVFEGYAKLIGVKN